MADFVSNEAEESDEEIIHRKRKRIEDDYDDDEEEEEDEDYGVLEDEDYDLIEEILGVKIQRKKKFKRIIDEDSDNEEAHGSGQVDDRVAIANELFKGDDMFDGRNYREKEDTLWCTPYRSNIYDYMRIIEKNFRPNPNYMDKQPHITIDGRCFLIDWLVYMVESHEKLNVEALHLAVSYVDRFLSHKSVTNDELTLLGTASLWIASKIENRRTSKESFFVDFIAKSYRKKEVVKMERLILKVLKFHISVPTAYTFLKLYCSMCNASETVANLSQYICELTLLDVDPFLTFTPSVIAAGSLALANYTFGLTMWDDEMEAASKYQLIDLMSVIYCLYKKYSSMASCPQQRIYAKYKSKTYNAVAYIPQPETLYFSGEFK